MSFMRLMEFSFDTTVNSLAALLQHQAVYVWCICSRNQAVRDRWQTYKRQLAKIWEAKTNEATNPFRTTKQNFLYTSQFLVILLSMRRGETRMLKNNSHYFQDSFQIFVAFRILPPAHQYFHPDRQAHRCALIFRSTFDKSVRDNLFEINLACPQSCRYLHSMGPPSNFFKLFIGPSVKDKRYKICPDCLFPGRSFIFY